MGTGILMHHCSVQIAQCTDLTKVWNRPVTYVHMPLQWVFVGRQGYGALGSTWCDVCCNNVFVCRGIACWTILEGRGGGGAGIGVELTAGAKIFCSAQWPNWFCGFLSLLSKGLELRPVVKLLGPGIGHAFPFSTEAQSALRFHLHSPLYLNRLLLK